MAQIMFVLRPSEKTKGFAERVVERFKMTQNIQLNLLMATNINDVAGQLESGGIAIMFNETPLEKSEINLLSQCYAKAKRKPFFILDDNNYDKLITAEVLASSKIPENLIGKATSDFTESFMYNCVRNLLTPPGQKLDIRYIKSIVTSVGDVITKNTQCSMEAKPIVETKAKEVPEEIAMVSAFYGDGFLGSITIGTEKKLMVTFAQKMLYCDESDVTTEMISDLSAELSNQILGAVRNSLSEFGWQLKSSMQVVTMGEEFLNASTSNGRYYHLPFTFQDMKFSLSFCYNTYQTSIREIEEESSSSGKSSLDVRLVNGFDSAIKKIIPANLGQEITFGPVLKHQNILYHEDSLHLFHAASWQGTITIGLEIPRSLSEFIMKQTMGMEPGDVDDTMVNDYWGEIINQVGGEFLKLVKGENYTFQRIYHGEFSGHGLDYVIKTPGLYFRQDLIIGEESCRAFFGADSSYGDQFHNIWPYFQALPSFHGQESIESSA
ncbi:chemotaxis protein CheX [Pseudobacteriovorax antillogorgiicola]|uniref:Chemotaxis protein CheX, a CheY~P-specific phosphatase n=1 Tax=Pseudobacteriovorax antillogorgiicola TaxID=1513793 RepID=A0A1Y6CVP5_9BACT|nr:chemotaxis protein CheX [Pseudobacteriovorax antillogorgiicola]TCS44599.1 CheY-specific phosphatase CheX [Pseudobacteriovorax antillogorgiicola]SMF78152.1 Chemotaxis protein CheX, a CheY~P-specific phosphatase [Pseudobacteriovorax antillogorgiicola]